MRDKFGARPLPRFTVRVRLTLAYSFMLVITAAVMLAVIYGFMRFVPSYDIAAPATSSTSGPVIDPGSDVPTNVGVTPVNPIVLTSADEILNTLLVTSLLVLLVLGAIGIGAGWFLAGRALRPLQRINDAAREAGHGALNHRIGLSGPQDEITDLAGTFDEMLGRLERSFEAHKRFAANASHELRTPIAASKTMIDVALAHPGRQQLPQLLQRLQTVNNHSTEIVESLLQLHTLAQGNLTALPLDLRVVASSGLRDVQEEATQLDVSVSIALDPAPLLGDEVLIKQLVVNLLHNALRHNCPNGTIEVRTGQSGKASFVEVSNTGEILPPDALELLSEPFYRGGGRANAGHVRGHGLGLALVQQISQAHDGELSLIPVAGGGLTVVVTFPAA